VLTDDATEPPRPGLPHQDEGVAIEDFGKILPEGVSWRSADAVTRYKASKTSVGAVPGKQKVGGARYGSRNQWAMRWLAWGGDAIPSMERKGRWHEAGNFHLCLTHLWLRLCLVDRSDAKGGVCWIKGARAELLTCQERGTRLAKNSS